MPYLNVTLDCAGRPEEAEVDIRSCILSLIDLYTHWLSQPIHTLLLQHMLSSVIMLSDLFAVVRSALTLVYNIPLHITLGKYT